MKVEKVVGGSSWCSCPETSAKGDIFGIPSHQRGHDAGFDEASADRHDRRLVFKRGGGKGNVQELTGS